VVAVEPGGERCFFHTPGVTKRLDAAAFRQCFPIFRQCSHVQIGYFGLLPALTADLPALLEELREAAPHVAIALDTVNPPASWEQLLPILPHLDVFCPSRVEAAALTGETEPGRMAAAFKRHMRDDVVIGIKLDAEGCYLEMAESYAIRVPSYKVDLIDTTGAGDTWFAGLLTGLIRGMPLEQAGRLANRTAADCCTALGASAGIRSFDDTVARL
jgi:sugar/nucleoside kinase (ribokinase family)